MTRQQVKKELIALFNKLDRLMHIFLARLEARETRTTDEFKEADHPRDKDGKFAKINSSKKDKKKEKSEEEKEKEEQQKFIEKIKEEKEYRDLYLQISNGETAEETKKLIEFFNANGVKNNVVKKLDKELSEDEIIKRIGGGDLTDEGSCASAAFAYAANKLGYDVLDFRGGISREKFSKWGVAEYGDFVALMGAYEAVADTTLASAHKIYPLIEKDKEYILGAGPHAAVVRKNKDSGELEYLELQDPYNNGFFPLTEEVLKERFRCDETKEEELKSAQLIDIDDLKENNNFISLLGYINTAENEQQKGLTGGKK